MKSHYSELDRLEKILVELEKLHLEGGLTQKRIETAQKRLDALAASIQHDESLGSRRFVLYEMQALLHDAAGDIDDARRFASEAVEVKGDADLITKTVRELVDATGSNIPKGKNYTRLEGWLALFGVGVIFAPFVQLYNFIGDMSTASSIPSTYAGFASLVYVEGFMNLFVGIAFVAYWPLLAKKRRAARSYGIWLFSIIIGLLLVDMVAVLGFSNLADSETISRTVGAQIWAILLNGAWLLYIVYSKRVKHTFVK